MRACAEKPVTSLPLVSEFLPSTGSALSREWVLTDVADNTQLATSQRLKEKLQKILATRTVAGTGDGRGEESDRRVREAESRTREAEREVERLREASETEKERLRQEKEEAEREKEVAETRQQELAAELAESEEKLQRLEAQWGMHLASCSLQCQSCRPPHAWLHSARPPP